MDIYERLEIPEENRGTSIRKKEAEFLYQFLKKHKLSKTLETGFAYGCSTAYIISATHAKHVAIDPHQDSYKNLGVKNVEKFGLSKYLRFIKERSHVALPNLLSEGVKIDFAFIDGDHKYDNIFIDWYYSDLMLEKNGYILFDDSWLRSTQMVAAFIETNREDYKRISTPIKNLIAFQKTGEDNRDPAHFEEFCPKVEQIPVTFEHSPCAGRSSCILVG